MNSTELIFFSSFIVFIVLVLILDLLFIGKKNEVLNFKQAMGWSIVWISLALAFFVFLKLGAEWVHGIKNPEGILEYYKFNAPHSPVPGGTFAEQLEVFRNRVATEFLTGYVIEYSLSIDNIFVIILILNAFAVKEKHYKPVLFWGILGALVFRFIFIFVGSALVHRFDWILLVFGLFLIYSGVKLLLTKEKEEKIEPKNHKVVKFLSRYFNVYPHYVRAYFFVRKNKKTFITPLFIVLIIIETTDLIFAMDSIPAIFAITRDAYIVFFSNIFAIIGLRSLFFMLVKVIYLFRFLKYGITILLIFVGFKLLLHKWLDQVGFTSEHSLYFILSVIVISILSSVLIKEKKVSLVVESDDKSA